MLAFQGYGMRQDYLAAKRYFTAAADLQMGDAQYMLGLIYYQGHGLKRHRKGSRALLAAAKLGSPKASL